MQNDIDTWFLESMFAHFRMAAHLVDNIDDAIVADELAKSINEISRRVAALLGKPYGPPAEEESSGSQAEGEPTKDSESDEPDLANMLDDVCDSVARADAFASAAKSLIREISAEEDRDNHRLARLAHLIDVTAEAMQEADDVGHVLVVKFAQRRPGHDGAS